MSRRCGPPRLLLLAAATTMLAGCASMSEQDCLKADWLAVGLKDGRQGTALDEITSHQESCAKTGVVPDTAKWRTGHAQGLLSYCTPNSGWNAGVANNFYHGVCAGLDEPTFLRHYRAGQAVWQARRDLSRNRSTLNRLEDELKKATKDDDRKRLRDEISRAERERGRLTALLVGLELAGPPR